MIDDLIQSPAFKRLIKRCFDKWGACSQIVMLAEEQAELFKAISHHWRNTKESSIIEITEELVDVMIMMAEFIVYLEINPADINEIIGFKLNALNSTLHKGEKSNG